MSPCIEGADAARSAIEVEPVPRVELVGKGASSVTVAAAETSAEPVPPSGSTAKKRSESGIDFDQHFPSAGAAIVGGDGGKTTSVDSPRRSRKVVKPHNVARGCDNRGNQKGGDKREPTQHSTIWAGRKSIQDACYDRVDTF